jgi:hypothetical protein
MEGPWTGEAQYDLERHADARAHALRARHLRSSPADFASDAPVGGITYTTDAAARMNGQHQPMPGQPTPDEPPPAPPAESLEVVPESAVDAAVIPQRVPQVVPAGWDEPMEVEAATARVAGPAAASLGGGVRLRVDTEAPDESPPVPAESTPQSRLRLRRGGLYDSDILTPDQIP